MDEASSLDGGGQGVQWQQLGKISIANFPIVIPTRGNWRKLIATKEANNTKKKEIINTENHPFFRKERKKRKVQVAKHPIFLVY